MNESLYINPPCKTQSHSLMLRQILLLTACTVSLSALCYWYFTKEYSVTCNDVAFNLGKAILGICSTGTNLSYPALCGPIDDKLFGVRVLSVGLGLEYNAEVYPLLTQQLLPSVEERMRAAAAHTYRASNMDLDKAVLHMAREQRSGLRRVSAALDKASERLVSRPQIVRFVTDSMYNSFWMRGGVKDEVSIKPETWAFVTRVFNFLKKEWLLEAEDALDSVRAYLSRREADIYVGIRSNENNNKQPLASDTTLYGRMASLTSYVWVVGGGGSSSSSSCTKPRGGDFLFEYEPVRSDKWLTFFAEMVAILGSVRVLSLFS